MTARAICHGVRVVASPDRAGLALFAFSQGLYRYGLAPSVVWADGVRLQMEILLGGSSYFLLFDVLRQVPTDGLPFARVGAMPSDNPVYLALGRLVLLLPWGEATSRLNALSALAASLAVLLAYHVGILLVRRRAAATLGALALAVSHTFWFHAVVTEVYSLQAAFLLAIIGLVVRWARDRRYRDLGGLAGIGGLGVANHVSFGLVLLPAAIYALVGAVRLPKQAGEVIADRTTPRLLDRRVGLLAALFVVAFGPRWVQLARMARLVGLDTALAAGSGSWLPRLVTPSSGEDALANVGTYVGLLLYQFMPTGVALGLYGFFRAWREDRRVGGLLIALFVVNAGFSANYSVPDRFKFHLPSYVVFALALMYGVDGLLHRLALTRPFRSIWVTAASRGLLLALTLAPLGVYALTPSAIRSLGGSERTFGIPPTGAAFRDGLSYFFNPNKRGDDSAERFGRATLAALRPRSLVFAAKPGDVEAYLVLRYFQLVEGRRGDVRVEVVEFVPSDEVPRAVLAEIRAQEGCRPLYLASLDPTLYPLATLQADFAIEPEANLYYLAPRRPTGSPRTCPAAAPPASPPFAQLLRDALR
jgi:hypothetical protein